ncbi:hypothetical protein Tco_1220506 [Tanacetum coccineum]
MYDSWASRIRLFIKGKKHGRMTLDLIDNGPLVSKFVIDVKLAKSLYTTNYDQLYAYLSQHERHANEVRIMRERYTNPLALVANSQTLYNPSQSPEHSGDDPIDCINKAMAFLSAVASRFGCPYDSDCDDISSAKAVLMANLSSCDSNVLSEIHSDSNIILYSQYLQESKDAIIPDTNSSAPNDLLVLSLVEQMTDHVANLDKENQTNKMVNESLTAELERYKERVAIFEQRQNVDLNKRGKLIDSQMDDLIRNRNSKLAPFQQEIDTLKETLSNHVKEKESL